MHDRDNFSACHGLRWRHRLSLVRNNLSALKVPLKGHEGLLKLRIRNRLNLGNFSDY